MLEYVGNRDNRMWLQFFETTLIFRFAGEFAAYEAKDPIKMEVVINKRRISIVQLC